MGYCSAVALCLNAEAEKKLHEYFNENQKSYNKEELSEIEALIESPDTLKKEEGSVLRYWDWCKWYLEFPGVQFITNFLDELDYSSYLFCRIGEELDDIERDGGFYDNPFELNVSVDLSF